ncbi:hypothetical protein ABH999_006581 [Bradyrhizobium yuanmingense]|uniref:hypothetical protein n=1 Tax=Bradyrhizobium yuanmingense TaxID=108015 RepID=UPI003517FE1D
MFTGSSTIAALLVLLKPVLEALFGAAGRAIDDRLAQRQARDDARDLGHAQATIETQSAAIEAQQAELDAAANAPRSTLDAIARLEEGSA